VREHWPVARYAIDASVPQGLDASWPAVSALAVTVLRSFLVVGGLALVLAFAACYLRRTWMQAALLVAIFGCAVRYPFAVPEVKAEIPSAG